MERQEACQRQQPDRAEEQHGTEYGERVLAVVAGRGDQEQVGYEIAYAPALARPSCDGGATGSARPGGRP